MANRIAITGDKKNNEKRQQKINQRVNVLEAKLLKMIDDYMEGKPVQTATDTLGNEYVWIYIGERKQFNGGNRKMPWGNNHKTEDIFSALYARMQKHGYVLCQHGGHDSKKDWEIEGWVLVYQNAEPIDKTEEKKLKVVDIAKNTSDMNTIDVNTIDINTIDVNIKENINV